MYYRKDMILFKFYICLVYLLCCVGCHPNTLTHTDTAKPSQPLMQHTLTHRHTKSNHTHTLTSHKFMLCILLILFVHLITHVSVCDV